MASSVCVRSSYPRSVFTSLEDRTQGLTSAKHNPAKHNCGDLHFGFAHCPLPTDNRFIECRQRDVIERILRHCGLWQRSLRTLGGCGSRAGSSQFLEPWCDLDTFSTSVGIPELE